MTDVKDHILGKLAGSLLIGGGNLASALIRTKHQRG